MTETRPDADRKEWAVLVYLVAQHRASASDPNKDLDPIVNQELDRIRDGLTASGGQDVVVAFQVSYNHDQPVTGAYPPRRARVIRGIVGGAAQGVADAQGSRFPGDPDILADFLRWAARAFPTRHYVVMFYGHSAGPAGLFPALRLLRNDSLRRFVRNAPPSFHHEFLQFLSRTPVPLSLADLRECLCLLPKRVELLLFKDCWTSALEAAYELRAAARLVVATQTEMPARLWDPLESTCRHASLSIL